MVLTGLYLAGGILLYFIQDLLMFHPKSLPADYRFTFAQPFEEINLAMGDRNLNVIQFKRDAPKGLILYFHGNMDNVERYASLVPALTALGYEVWMPDYPGYGKSTGKRTEETLYRDAAEVYAMAIKKFGPGQIVIWGRSIGTGVASQLASVNKCGMLILETPYHSMRALAKDYFPIYPVLPLLKYSLPVSEYVKKVQAPVYIFHGTEDEVVPYAQARRIKKENPPAHLVTFEGGHHNDLALHHLFQPTVTRILFR
jgi:hypothetical protein